MTQYAGQNKLATTIPLPDANTPFNASAIGAPIAANRDSIVALTNSGLYRTTLNTAKPPYPLAGEHVNVGTYKITEGSTIEFSTAKGYYRVASPNARFVSGKWTVGYGSVISNAAAHTQVDFATTDDTVDLVFFFDLPDGAILKRAVVRLDGSAGHGALPGIKPRIEIWLHDITTGIGSMVAGANDAPAGIGAYEALHVLDVTLPDTAFDAGLYIVTARISGEAGSDGQAGLVVLAPTIEWERAKIGEELGAVLP
jgi:hypothetical protein